MDGERFQQGQALLREGRWAEGWPLLDTRVRLAPDLVPPGPATYPEWMGEPLEGRSILVWIEQGLGDQIMFGRFATLLKARGAGRVTLVCRPPVAPVLETIPGVDAVVAIPVNGSAPIPRHQLWTRYFSLPARLGITLETLPSDPYVRAPHPRPAGQGFGLVWRTSVTGGVAHAKTLPEAQARRLAELGAVSLHPEDTGARDLGETADIISGLRLVVSVDTAVAHLAGAMGKPVWILLHRPADWRWLDEARTDSPWYPSARLFRQKTPGDWEPVVSQVLAELRG
ncbi:glycosyltransferase family 9 protein [Phenylobacterium sp. VNQ135]|uniref:glycosyltransferase family 9 protein n=1 Tax=Phenylobacterium sp. VNQ135 TaxID=3400922 RepID=UPI003BFE1E03